MTQENKGIEIWKPISDIPTKHWNKNDSISPLYLVRCGEDENGVSILGYSHYSFISNSWIDCFRATSPGLHKVKEWTDVKI